MQTHVQTFSGIIERYGVCETSHNYHMFHIQTSKDYPESLSIRSSYNLVRSEINTILREWSVSTLREARCVCIQIHY